MAVSINKCEYPIPKLERESWSKESLFRKSQTTDVKLLLQNIGCISKTKRDMTANKDEWLGGRNWDFDERICDFYIFNNFLWIFSWFIDEGLNEC